METSNLLSDMMGYVNSMAYSLSVDYTEPLDKEDKLSLKLLCEEYIIAYDKEYPTEEYD